MIAYMLYSIPNLLGKLPEDIGGKDSIDNGPSESLETFISHLGFTLCVIAVLVISLSLSGLFIASAIDHARHGSRNYKEP